MLDNIIISMSDGLIENLNHNLNNWTPLDGARYLEGMKEYFIDNLCEDGEMPRLLDEEVTGLGLAGIKCNRCWILLG